MKKVFLHAYCQQNLGDDMFVLRMLQRYPNVQFHAVVDGAYRGAFADTPNLVVHPRKKTNRLVEQLHHRFGYDAFIKLGGSIFMEPKDWKQKGTFPVWQCKLLNSNKFIIGANFGPHYTDAFLKRAYSSLRFYRGVSFRDQASYDLFADIPQACWAPDLLFQYDYPAPKQGSGVGISVIAPERKLPEGLTEEQYYTAMAQIADRYLEQGEPVRLLGFCDAERDGEAMEQIRSRMCHADQLETVLYDGDIPKMLDAMNGCDKIIAARFHAMIIGFALRKKVLPVIYSQKQTHVLEDLGFDGRIWDLRKAELLTPEEAQTACDNAPIVEGLQELATRCDEQFTQLDKYLK